MHGQVLGTVGTRELFRERFRLAFLHDMRLGEDKFYVFPECSHENTVYTKRIHFDQRVQKAVGSYPHT